MLVCQHLDVTLTEKS